MKGGVAVSSRLDAPAALTSIQKQVRKDLKGQGQGGCGGGGVSVQCRAVCVFVCVCVWFICRSSPAGWQADCL